MKKPNTILYKYVLLLHNTAYICISTFVMHVVITYVFCNIVSYEISDGFCMFNCICDLILEN